MIWHNYLAYQRFLRQAVKTANGAIACAAWLLFAAIFRYSSLATLLSIVVAAIAAWFLADHRAATLLTLLVPLVWARHHANVSRLLKGTEPKIGQRGETSASGA